MVLQFDYGDSGDAFDVPHRCDRGLEYLLCRSFCDFHRYILRRSVCAAGPADDDRASRGFAVSSWADADRRRGQAGEVVLRFEAGQVEGKRRASLEWAGYVTLAQLDTPSPGGIDL